MISFILLTLGFVCFSFSSLFRCMASLVAQMVNLPKMQETWVQYLRQEDPLERRMATHSSILAWRIPMDRGAWWTAVHGVAKSWTRQSDNTTLMLLEIVLVSRGKFVLL